MPKVCTGYRKFVLIASFFLSLTALRSSLIRGSHRLESPYRSNKLLVFSAYYGLIGQYQSIFTYLYFAPFREDGREDNIIGGKTFMNKRLATLLSLGLVLCLLAGCVGTPVVYNCTEDHSTTAPVETTPNTPSGSQTPVVGALKTGLAIVGNITGSKSAEYADYDITMVAVLVDEGGIIRDCIIDGISAKVNLDGSGNITSQPEEILTKNQLGENYGMVAYGGAKYEWNVQAEALAQYAVGKTVEELRSGAINEQGKAPEGSDLASTATIYLGGYVSAIETAVANAQVLGAQSGDVLKLGILPAMDAGWVPGEGGDATVTVDAAALTENNSRVTSCLIDSLQAKVSFDGTGTITTDLSTPLQTKNELGENYGMVAYGGAIAEWNVQAASFASYICGKTAEEIEGIAVNENMTAAEVDLASSVTIAIGEFQNLILTTLAQVRENAPTAPLKTGLAIVGNISGSENASKADYDVTVVAVLVDEAGVIQACIIDGISAKTTFDATGAVTSAPTAPISTKNELGDGYGMVAYGGAKYEWNVQAAALAEYAVGKTVGELRNGAVNEQGRAPEGTDLASTATIYLGGYVSAIEAAVANAQALGAQSGDSLKLAVLPTMEATGMANEGGSSTLTVDATALTENQGVVTSCLIDSLQAKVAFDGTGTITTDLTAPLQTKNELGENYGMVAWGGAIAEWNVQAASFASYICGKTGEEIRGIAVNEKTAPTEVDLVSSVTIAIGGFQALVLKALGA